MTKSQSLDQIRAQNTSLDLIAANKSKQQPKSSLKAGYESKIRLTKIDQIRAQNTSLDLITANKSKQQPKSSLKARYESKTRFKIMNLIKKLKIT